VAAKSDDQEDCEPQDLLDEIDEEWPPNPLNDVDEEWPPPDPLNQVDDLPPPPPRKRRASVHFDNVVADGPLLSGPHRLKAPHRCRAEKRARIIESEGHTARPSTLCDHIQSAEPLLAPSFDTATLPTAHGAYAAKVETKSEKHGAKQRRSLAELIAVGFQLIRWDGV
jgi:hypothetical protein